MQDVVVVIVQFALFVYGPDIVGGVVNHVAGRDAGECRLGSAWGRVKIQNRTRWGAVSRGAVCAYPGVHRPRTAVGRGNRKVVIFRASRKPEANVGEAV